MTKDLIIITEEEMKWAIIMVCQISHEPPIELEEDFFEIGMAKMHSLIDGEDIPFVLNENGMRALKEICIEVESDDENFDIDDLADGAIGTHDYQPFQFYIDKYIERMIL